MKECAFCSHSAKLSGEHIISDWINPLFPGEKVATFTDTKGREREWTSPDLDWTAKVVCKKCNETWMSDIESLHAKPVMTRLIQGEFNIPIGPPEARSIALFAFKTAVVLDHTRRDRPPFFSKDLRHAFREHLIIPNIAQMWMCAYAPGARRINVHFGHWRGDLSPTYPIRIYVCTCGIGNFAFQVVTINQPGFASFMPLPGFEDLAVPLWPTVLPNFVWPPRKGLMSAQEFKKFCFRWESTAPVNHSF